MNMKETALSILAMSVLALVVTAGAQTAPGGATQPATCPIAFPSLEDQTPESWFARAAAEIDSLPDAEAKSGVDKLIGIARADAGDFEGAKQYAEKVGSDQRDEILSSVILGYSRRQDIAAIKPVAEMIANVRIRDNSLRRAVSVLCGKGRLAEALEVAAIITEQWQRSKALGLVAKKQALAGRMEEAKATVERIPHERARGLFAQAIAKIETVATSDSATDGRDEGSETDRVEDILTGLAAARAREGKPDDSLRFAGRHDSQMRRATAYASAAEALADQGDNPGAEKALRLAEEAAALEGDRSCKAIAYSRLTEARLKTGDVAGARQDLRNVLEINNHEPDTLRLEVGSFSASGKPALIGMRLRMGDVEDALAAARTPNGDFGWMDCYLIGLILAETGKMEDLAKFLPALVSPAERIYACTGVGAGLLARKQAKS